MQRKASVQSLKETENSLKHVPDYAEIKESIKESENAVGISDNDLLLICGTWIIISVLVPLIYYLAV